MEVSALVILLVVLALTVRLLVGAHRLLVSRRSTLARIAVATAGVGYGIDPALRVEAPGLAACLLTIGVVAAASLIRDLIRVLDRMPRSRSVGLTRTVADLDRSSRPSPALEQTAWSPGPCQRRVTVSRRARHGQIRPAS